MIIPIGSLIDAGAIVVGGTIGLLLQKRFSAQIQKVVLQGIGLSTLLIGLQMAFKVENIIVLIFSLVLGGIVGELLNLESKLENLGDFLKRKVNSKNTVFTDGFVIASVLLCSGAMSILGSINEGISGDRTVLLTKAVLDGVVAIAFASTYGLGVLFSALPILIYQGSITIASSYLQSFFTATMINQLSAVGGLLIVGIGINILGATKIKIMNLLPALFFVIFFTFLLEKIG